MADEVQRLLHYIAEHYTGLEEAKDVERSAAAETAEEIIAGQRRVMRKERALADRLARPFQRGLHRAYAAYRAGGNAISLDDRDPEENQIAEALIHFLVGPGLAHSMTRETEPMHYTYIITINWARLAALAHEANVDLDALLKPTT
ncbi:hypothetical protein NET02_04985 [Thermomicrobiaceae bacterium CFH 74404]|uniref:Uncharacterized protein n=1 Tax=Thermalbibacter longus TaxID=2951981 RepID=A0AA41WFK0_9BACT|nr:hypothetical protein [Thermalbibacter longus]MCM8748491.1 hypothetical protein [Thermalbibacter longus]